MKSEKWKIGQSQLIPRSTTAKNEEGGSSCKRHPSLDLDTICFHPVCRQQHCQIICSYCGQESQQHRKHIEQQFPIYRTSPGFRLVSKYPAEGNDLRLPPILEENNEATEEIKALVESQMQQVQHQSMQKVKCLGEFLNKNAIFSICNKIRRENGGHQDCCLRMINKLKDIEAGGETSQRYYYKAVCEEIQSAKEKVKQQAQYIKGEISKLFANLKTEVKIEEVQPSIEELYTSKNEDRGNNFGSSLINELMNISDQQRRQNFMPNEEILPQIKQKRHTNRSKSVVISRKNQNKVPKGIEQVNANTVRIWNPNAKKYYEIFKYLSAQTTTTHIIIDNDKLTSNTHINTILSKMSWLQGLHIHCKSKFYFRIPHNNKLDYFSILPSYRFIRLVDRSSYFCCSQIKTITEEQGRGNMEAFADDVRFKNMYIYKTSDIKKIPQFIEELHFFRNEHYPPLTLKRQFLLKLEFSRNLLVLSFQDIIFGETVSFKHIFQGCCQLHTLVFKNCEGRFNKMLKQLRYLKVFQLCHLQLSGDSEKKICLQPYFYKEIFHNKALETLIFTNVEFLDENKTVAKNSLVLKDIHKLKFLTHLNLYNSEPVYNDLLEYINKENYQNMEMLNLGRTQITSDATKKLSRFRNLESLCLDYTGFRDAELLQITKDMWALKHLSIEHLQVSSNFFSSMSFKSLKTVNIYGCVNLHDYRWENYSELEFLRINKGQISFDLFYYLRARAINIQEASPHQDQNRSLEQSGNTNDAQMIQEDSWTIEEESNQSDSESGSKNQKMKKKLRDQSLDQRRAVSVRLDESTVATYITRSRAKRLETHDLAERSIPNPLSILLNSKVETPTMESEQDANGSVSNQSDQDSD